MYKTKCQQQKAIRARHLISFRRYISLKGSGDAVIDYLNMDAFELRNYISSQWQQGMSWDNYGEFWIVDHIVPLRYFEPTSIKDMKLCWDYNNLQASYYWDNHAKGYCVEVTKNILEGMVRNASVDLLLKKIEHIQDMFANYYENYG